jgi:hypothetical protein
MPMGGSQGVRLEPALGAITNHQSGLQTGIGCVTKRHMKQFLAQARRATGMLCTLWNCLQWLLRLLSQRICVPLESLAALKDSSGRRRIRLGDYEASQ